MLGRKSGKKKRKKKKPDSKGHSDEGKKKKVRIVEEDGGGGGGVNGEGHHHSENDEESGTIITLKSENDRLTVEMDIKHLKWCPFLKKQWNHLRKTEKKHSPSKKKGKKQQDSKASTTVIIVPHCTQSMLHLLLQFLQLLSEHQTSEYESILFPISTQNIGGLVSSPFAHWLESLSNEQCLEMALMGSYLQIHALSDMCSAKIACQLKDTPTEQWSDQLK